MGSLVGRNANNNEGLRNSKRLHTREFSGGLVVVDLIRDGKLVVAALYTVLKHSSRSSNF